MAILVTSESSFFADRKQVGECFTLCDAGGGTVDVVSYKVTQLVPTLELEKMTMATSEKCGSAYIDANFKRWLQRVIGDRYYRVLDPRNIGQQVGVHTSESKQMRQLMKEFDPHKKAFSNNVGDVMMLDLPAPLEKLNIVGKVSEGELIITHEEMKAIFDLCVDEVVQLIQGQITQVEMKHYRVKNVFLVGGFGESPYLQEELKRSLNLRKITMRRPDTKNSWTAVVRGAAIYGIEKEHHKNVVSTSTCASNYAVVLNDSYSSHKNDPRDRIIDPLTGAPMAQKQFTWLVRRGDLILSDEKKEIEREIVFRFQENDERKFQVPVYEYPDDDDEMPDRFETGENELIKVAVLNCDLSNSFLGDFEKHENPNTKKAYYVLYLIFKMELCGTSVNAELRWNERLVCSTKIKDLQTIIG